ncbi:hypothetical protein SH2C18_39730 [Clostridium sediminicola]
MVRLHKESKYINIEKNLSKERPLITGNNVQLQQAFINILINTIQVIENKGNISIDSYYLKEKGIGFGLSIAKMAIDKHGGEIKVNSKLNEGTTFEVYLPIRKE